MSECACFGFSSPLTSRGCLKGDSGVLNVSNRSLCAFFSFPPIPKSQQVIVLWNVASPRSGMTMSLTDITIEMSVFAPDCSIPVSYWWASHCTNQHEKTLNILQLLAVVWPGNLTVCSVKWHPLVFSHLSYRACDSVMVYQMLQWFRIVLELWNDTQGSVGLLVCTVVNGNWGWRSSAAYLAASQL